MSSLAYERRGAGEPLVLLHPLGGRWQIWEPVLDELAEHHDVIVPDLPGFGASPPLPVPPDPAPARLAQAVAGLLEELGLDRPHVAGNSLGGWVALELGLAAGARSVTGLCTAGLWPQPLAPRRGLARQVARGLLPVVSLLVRTGTGRRLALGSTLARPEEVSARAAAGMVRAYALAPGFDDVNAAMRRGRFQGLAEIPVPVTLAWGELDRLVRPPSRIPPGVRNTMLAGCGHLPMWDDPPQVAALLLEQTGARPARGPTAVARAGTHP